MTQKSWMTWIWVAVFLWTPSVSLNKSKMMHPGNNKCKLKKPWKCFRNNIVFVADTFTSFIDNTNQLWESEQKYDIMFLQRNSFDPALKKNWPQMEIKDDAYILYISEKFLKWNHQQYVLYGENCTTQLKMQDETTNGSCQKRRLDKSQCKKKYYDEHFCSNHGQMIRDRFVINITATEANCINCYTPVKTIDTKIVLNTTFPDDGNKIDPAKASVLMEDMARLVSSSNESTIAVSAGEGVTGILQKTEPLDPEEVSFAYSQPTDDLQIIQDKQLLPDYLRSITVSKEAFEKAVSANISEPFVAVFRFLNMGQDEQNSNVLGDEVVAVEMGRTIKNLTDTININFLETDYVGTPHCNSWDGKGSRPNWTDEGCETVTSGKNITCRCSHLTFFAILLTPPEEISSSDLNTLTIITQAGCGISMFFLGIVLFMHCLLRKGKATKATRILIHLVLAMFFLNFTFLTNNFVAKTKNDVGCKIMAALMHYFMLATLTLFAVQAFHICIQLYKGGRIDIHHYILKVSIISWVIPSIIAVVLFSTGKYGEQVIYTDSVEDNVAMCWITDVDIHYFVNVSYYALVFLFTFTTFIITLLWLHCLKRSKSGSVQAKRNGISIITILGLCCMLGITWGFAFFAYGVLRMPATYIFTVLNSFQGFFLFIYYHFTSHSKETDTAVEANTESSSTTQKTGLDIFENPYNNPPAQEKK